MQLCELQSRPVHTVTSGAGETYLTQNQNPGINKRGSALALSDSGEDLNLCPLHCSVGRAAATSPPPRAWAGTVRAALSGLAIRYSRPSGRPFPLTVRRQTAPETCGRDFSRCTRRPRRGPASRAPPPSDLYPEWRQGPEQGCRKLPPGSLNGGAAPLRTPSGLRAAGREAAAGQPGSPAHVERTGAAQAALTNKDLTLQPRRALTFRFSLRVSPRKGGARVKWSVPEGARPPPRRSSVSVIDWGIRLGAGGPY